MIFFFGGDRLMKKLFVLIIILSFVSISYGINQTGRNLSTGYGYVAGVDSIDAVTVNPANLDTLSQNEVMVTFNRPFIFHSFYSGIPLFEDKLLGLGFVKNNNIQQVRIGLTLFDPGFFKLGFNLGFDREIGWVNSKYGFVLSPGLIINLIDARRDNFSIDLGFNYKNAVHETDIKNVDELKEKNLDLGLRSELFIEDLFLNVGGNNYDKEWDYTVSLEFLLIEFFNVAVLMGKEKLGWGSDLILDNHKVSFGYQCDEDNKSYNYALSYSVKTGEKIRKRRVYRRRRVTRRAKRKQKALLEEGLQLYKDKKYKEARNVWRKCVRLGPRTEYAKSAKQYLIKVNNILDSLEEE